MTDWGVHMIDMILAGMKVSAPVSVAAAGGKHGQPGSAIETPDTLHTVYDFKDFSLIWEHTLGVAREPYNRNSNSPGVSFTGNNGTLVIDRDSWDVYPEMVQGKYATEVLPTRENNHDGLALHIRNFLDCIQSRKEPNCTIEMGRDAALCAQLGNIAFRLKKQVKWNEERGSFHADAEADALAKARYREPWKLPNI